METANKKKYRYFLYSAEQHKLRESIDKKINKVFTPGNVLVRGKWMPYTEISQSPNNGYSDSRVIISGNLSDITYTNHSSIWGAQ